MSYDKKIIIKTLSEIVNDNSIQPDAIIDDGVLLEKSLLLITAEQKTGKSFLGYNLAIAISEGRDFAFFKIKDSHRVLYLSAEGGYPPNRDRIKKMCQAYEIENNKLVIAFNTNWLIDTEEGLAEFRRMIEEFTPNVVIIDPLVRFHQQDENSANGMSKVFGIFRGLMEEYSFAMIIIHHLGKDRFRAARGSSVILGEYDTSITLEGNIKTGIKCIFDMRHVVTPDPKKIKFNPDNCWFNYENDSQKSRFEEILKPECSLPRNILSKRAVDRKLVSRVTNAYRQINKEIQEGKLKVDADGKIALM